MINERLHTGSFIHSYYYYYIDTLGYCSDWEKSKHGFGAKLNTELITNHHRPTHDLIGGSDIQGVQ